MGNNATITRLVRTWPADASPSNPLITPWPLTDELIEGVEFVDEAAARRLDLDRAVGESGCPPGGDVTDAGPWVACWTWGAPAAEDETIAALRRRAEAAEGLRLRLAEVGVPPVVVVAG